MSQVTEVATCAARDCDKAIEPAGRTRRFCSKRCADRAWKGRDRAPVLCAAPFCRRTFRQKRSDAKYCSSDCRWNTWALQNRPQPRPRTCVECGAQVNRRLDAVYCSVACKKRYLGRRREHRMRAQRRGAVAISYTKGQLADKLAYWGFRCWMCGDPYQEIDHVKPLSAGGLDILANLRPACGPCNRAKGAQWPVTTRAAA